MEKGQIVFAMSKEKIESVDVIRRVSVMSN